MNGSAIAACALVACETEFLVRRVAGAFERRRLSRASSAWEFGLCLRRPHPRVSGREASDRDGTSCSQSLPLPERSPLMRPPSRHRAAGGVDRAAPAVRLAADLPFLGRPAAALHFLGHPAVALRFSVRPAAVRPVVAHPIAAHLAEARCPFSAARAAVASPPAAVPRASQWAAVEAALRGADVSDLPSPPFRAQVAARVAARVAAQLAGRDADRRAVLRVDVLAARPVGWRAVPRAAVACPAVGWAAVVLEDRAVARLPERPCKHSRGRPRGRSPLRATRPDRLRRTMQATSLRAVHRRPSNNGPTRRRPTARSSSGSPKARSIPANRSTCRRLRPIRWESSSNAISARPSRPAFTRASRLPKRSARRPGMWPAARRSATILRSPGSSLAPTERTARSDRTAPTWVFRPQTRQNVHRVPRWSHH